jgi:uncharacterized protein YodC (DUF2158 family)
MSVAEPIDVLEVGHVVRMASGSPAMVVAEIDGSRVRCEFFDYSRGDIVSVRVRAAFLVKVPPHEAANLRRAGNSG